MVIHFKGTNYYLPIQLVLCRLTHSLNCCVCYCVELCTPSTGSQCIMMIRLVTHKNSNKRDHNRLKYGIDFTHIYTQTLKKGICHNVLLNVVHLVHRSNQWLISFQWYCTLYFFHCYIHFICKQLKKWKKPERPLCIFFSVRIQ